MAVGCWLYILIGQVLQLSLCSYVTKHIPFTGTDQAQEFLDKVLKGDGDRHIGSHGDKEAEEEDIPHPIIMWWTGFTGEPGTARQCGDVTCFFTADRHYKDHPSMKVFMIYGTDYNPYDLPVPRQVHHEWGLFHEESPKNNYYFSHKETMSLFNHTATFRRESDYPITTQHLKDLEELESQKFLLTPEHKNRLMREEGLALIAYVQSDCGTASDRDHFVKMLQRHIQVDSYGKCENNKQLPEHLRDPLAGMEHADFYKFLGQYKFTLAMENAVCDDYITEKFWRPFIVGTVPVVFGSSKAEDYLPDSHSAIYLEDFQTVEELARFLLHLNSSNSEYSKYLKFKETGVTNSKLHKEMEVREWGVNDYSRPNFIEGFECLVCKRIHKNMKLESQSLPSLQYQADLTHYGCPKPKRFSDKPLGNLMRVDDTWWSYEYDSTQYKARAVSELIAQGKPFGQQEIDSLVKSMAHHHDY